LKPRRVLIENLRYECDEEGEREMNHEPQRAVREEAKRDGRDGLAAVAITLLAVALIILVLTKIV
jgi:hypothetical protein